MVPIGEIADESEQRFAQILIGIADIAWHGLQDFARLGLEVLRAVAVAGSGSSTARSTALEDASGRRAHQRCSVEGLPCRTFFSRAACFDTAAIGKSTSARRLHSRGIIEAAQAAVAGAR